jgi:hypothetical protein
MGPIDSGSWRTARTGGFGLLHLAVSLLLFVALTASHGLTSPHWAFHQHGIGSASHGDPLDAGFNKALESVTHVRSRVAAKNASPWRRESASAPGISSLLAAFLVRIELPKSGWRTVRPTTVAIPDGPLPRTYDPQGPPPSIA